MKASDLLGSKVYTRDGKELGHLYDIEARRTGPFVSEAWGNALQVSGLLVGSFAVLQRLGYQRRVMRGPLGLKFFADRLKGYRIRWNQLAAIEQHRIFLNCGIDELELISGKETSESR
jgi:PRC-barrel domain protein